MRLVYFGGRFALEALLAGIDGLPVNRAEQLASANLALAAKAVAAANVPLDEQRSIEALRAAADFQLEQEKLALEREKLAFEMRRWLELQREPQRGAGDRQSDGVRSAEPAGQDETNSPGQLELFPREQAA
jgi:hypothetical protein